MNKSLVLLLILVLSCSKVPIVAKDKKVQSPPQTYPKSKLINRSCDAVWSAAVPIMTEAGFTAQTVERASGLASFIYNKQSSEYTSTEDVKRYTVAPAGFWTRYSVLAIQSASLTVTQGVGACTCQIAINYVGLQRSVLAGSNWYALESNGLAEQTFLQKIEGQALLAEGAVPAISGSEKQIQAAPAVESKAQIAVSSTPNGAEIELDGRFVGSTPSTIPLSIGRHRLTISKAGYQKWTRDLNSIGGDVSVVANLVLGTTEEPRLISTDTTQANSPLAPPGKVRIVCPEKVTQVPFSSARPDKKTLECGTEVTIVSASAQWIRVRTTDGVEGSISAKFISR